MNFNLKSEKRILYGKIVKAMDYENNVRVALLSSEKLEALEKQNAIEQESMASAQVEQLDFGGAQNNNLSAMTVTQPEQTTMLDSNPMMSSSGMNKFINFDGGPTPGDVGPSQAANGFGLPISNVGGSDMLQVTNPQDLNTLMSIVPTNVETVQNTSVSPFAANPIPVSNPIQEEAQLQQPMQPMIPPQDVPTLNDLQVPTREVLANEPTNVNENLFSSLSMDKPPVVETVGQPAMANQIVAQPAAVAPAPVQPTPMPVAQPTTYAADGTPMVSSTQMPVEPQPVAVAETQAQPAVETQAPRTITDINEFREYVLDKADEYYQKFLDDIEAVLDQAVEQKETLGELPQTQNAQTLDNPLINDAFTHISNISIDPGAPGGMGMAA